MKVTGPSGVGSAAAPRGAARPTGDGFTLGGGPPSAPETAPAGLIDAPVVARGRASIGNATGSLDAAVLRAL